MKLPFSRTVNTYLRERKLQSKLKKQGWTFSPLRARFYLYEYGDWEKYYLSFDVTMKTVLDVGAGEGETALFYFNHGAVKVVCVEPDPEAFELLRKNGTGRCMPLLRERFSLDLIGYVQLMLLEQGQPGLDLVKVDIEGYEEELLGYKGSVPVVCEVHGLQLLDKFEVAGWSVVCPSRFLCTGYAFWKCNLETAKRRTESC